MSWICISCSQKHIEDNDDMGFGVCDKCQEKIKVRKAKEKTALLAARAKKYAKIARRKF